MTKKKSKAVIVDGVPIKTISATEHSRLKRRIKKKHGKTEETLPRSSRQESGLDFAWVDEGTLFFAVRFTDGKCFSVTYSPHVLDTVDFSDVSTGDDVILKTYYQREDL